ncbi:MAG: hypothetical protein KAV82_04160 [Phycisphaerae bacterium]|nr:hypothetical protein [Phycisphaerae bacterium]
MSFPATSVAEPTVREVFHLVCGGCGGDVVVDRGSLSHHVQCPHCSQQVKVLRLTSFVCEHCGASGNADLTGGSRVVICEECNRPHALAVVTAPVVHSHRHHRHHHHAGRLPHSDVGAQRVALT